MDGRVRGRTGGPYSVATDGGRRRVTSRGGRKSSACVCVCVCVRRGGRAANGAAVGGWRRCLRQRHARGRARWWWCWWPSPGGRGRIFQPLRPRGAREWPGRTDAAQGSAQAARQAATATRDPVSAGARRSRRAWTCSPPHSPVRSARTMPSAIAPATASIPLGGRPAGPTGGALHVLPFSRWGRRILFKPGSRTWTCRYTDLWAPYDPWIWALYDRSVFIASTETERKGPTVGELPERRRFRMGGRQPAGRPAQRRR
jgi:hypothetical protein